MSISKSINCDVHISQWGSRGNATDIFLPPNENFVLIIDYPLNIAAEFKFDTGKAGLGFAGIVNKIANAYSKIYDNEEKYGVYGHSFNDLVLEGMEVNFKSKTINIFVGS